MKYQKITAQDRLWVIGFEEIQPTEEGPNPVQKSWDGIGYPDSTTVYACLLANEIEVDNLEKLYAELSILES